MPIAVVSLDRFPFSQVLRDRCPFSFLLRSGRQLCVCSLLITRSIHCHFASLPEVLSTRQVEAPRLTVVCESNNPIDGFDVLQKSGRLMIGGGQRVPGP